MAEKQQTPKSQKSGEHQPPFIDEWIWNLLKRSPHIGVFCLALVIRLVYLAEMEGSPVFSVLMGDGESYDLWGQEIASGDWFGDQVFYQAPLYPYLLGTVYALFGHHFFVVRLIQCVSGSVACLLLTRAGSSFFSQRVGVIAGVILAFYPPAIFFDGLIQKGSLALLFTCALLYVLGKQITAPRRLWPLLTGLILGLFALTRENAMILIPVAGLWLLLQFRNRPLAVRMQWLAGLVLGIALLLVPVGIRNQTIGGEFLVTTSQLGPNFYIGNNPNANGLYESLRPDRGSYKYERRDAIDLAEEAMSRSLSPTEVSRYWMRRSLSYITSQPLDWLALMAKKWLLVWNAAEQIDTESLEMYKDHSIILRGFGWFLHLGILCPLAALGIISSRRDWRRLWLLYVILASIVASVTLFYIFARYRFPMVPLLTLFSARGLADLPEIARTTRPRRLAPIVGIVVAVGIFSNWPVPSNDDPRAIAYLNLGNALLDEKRYQEAGDAFEQSLRTRPDAVNPRVGLAKALHRLGRLNEATAHFQLALVKRPHNVGANVGFGILLAQQGRLDEAMSHLKNAVNQAPDDKNAHSNLGNVYRLQGNIDDAIHHYNEAVRLDPELLEARLNLAFTLAQLERWDGALIHCTEALRLDPEHVDAHILQGTILARRGRFKEAIHHYGEALLLQPDNTEARAGLAQLRAYELSSKKE